ncbi:DDE_3 domain-containing protein [Trichonephila clavipes]|nr:DDE_3 domain-containing protein [Trichonephila clavipes]
MLSSPPGALYQQDNARAHTARLSQQRLQGYDVRGLPGQSSRTPTEQVWDVLGSQLPLSRHTGEFTAQLQRFWHDFPQEVIGDLIDLMSHRVKACIAARGGFTIY